MDCQLLPSFHGWRWRLLEDEACMVSNVSPSSKKLRIGSRRWKSVNMVAQFVTLLWQDVPARNAHFLLPHQGNSPLTSLPKNEFISKLTIQFHNFSIQNNFSLEKCVSNKLYGKLFSTNSVEFALFHGLSFPFLDEFSLRGKRAFSILRGLLNFQRAFWNTVVAIIRFAEKGWKL